MTNPSEQTELKEKRQALFSLWSAPQVTETGPAQVSTSASTRASSPTPQHPVTVQTQPTDRPQKAPTALDEVQRLINRIADPNADRMFLR